MPSGFLGKTQLGLLASRSSFSQPRASNMRTISLSSVGSQRSFKGLTFQNSASFWTLLVLVTPMAVTAYNDVASDPPPVIQSIASDLLFDEHDRLASHALVYDAGSPQCQEMIKTKIQNYFIDNPSDAARFQLAGLEGDALDRVFGPYRQKEVGNDTIGCMAACIEVGVERDLAGYVMPEYVYNSQEYDNGIVQWFQDMCIRKELCLLNYHSDENPLEVYQKNPNGDLEHYSSLDYGEANTGCSHVLLGANFVVMDESDPDNHFVVGELTIEHTTVKAWGEFPPSGYDDDSFDFVAEIESTLSEEWYRHSLVTRTFSPLGFKKGRLPKDVYASLRAFYHNNAENIVTEEWNDGGVFVNWWETNVMFLQIPWGMMKIYQHRLRTMVEEWAGVPIEETVMYGLRQYTEGARLLTHVDRLSTHAVSLIVNIAQGNLTEPWPVEVHDHADRLHEVLMEPGDVVYYESAKALHGRNRPMMGENAYYVNLFTHYRPTGDAEWYKKPNPEGTPEPVLGGKRVWEECRLVEQRVECDNPELGPFISPSLFQAEGPEDLIRWWQTTSPEYQEGEYDEGDYAGDIEEIDNASSVLEGDLDNAGTTTNESAADEGEL